MLNVIKLILIGITIFILVCARPLVANADTWRGTAPFCDGECKAGETEIRRDKSGNGATCWTGTKVLCSNDEQECVPRQTRTDCKGPVMICNDGYYIGPDNWKSCSKYACGVCIGGEF